jgi:hypothetical protein
MILLSFLANSNIVNCKLLEYVSNIIYILYIFIDFINLLTFDIYMIHFILIHINFIYLWIF